MDMFDLSEKTFTFSSDRVVSVLFTRLVLGQMTSKLLKSFLNTSHVSTTNQPSTADCQFRIMEGSF